MPWVRLMGNVLFSSLQMGVFFPIPADSKSNGPLMMMVMLYAHWNHPNTPHARLSVVPELNPNRSSHS